MTTFHKNKPTLIGLRNSPPFHLGIFLIDQISYEKKYVNRKAMLKAVDSVSIADPKFIKNICVAWTGSSKIADDKNYPAILLFKW